MPKHGILHDYDLWANKEASAENQICTICGSSPMSFQWSDYSGEAMCTNCGCPYQLKWGTEDQKKEDNYPYLSLSKEYLSAAREYWGEEKKFVCYGMMLGGSRPGINELIAWLRKYHPEFIKES